MTENRIFRGFDITTGTWTDGVAIGAAGLGLALFLLLLVLRRDRDLTLYDNHLAWLRAGIYFLVCIALSAATGVTERLFDNPWGLSDPPNIVWLVSTAVYLAIIVYGYWVYWPRGTYTQGRGVYWTLFPFALTWGFCEAQLWLSFWALFEMVGLSTFWVAVMTFAAGTLLYPWHMHYWDMYVAPAHNILDENGRKAMVSHIPNSAVAIIYFAAFESVGIHVIMQTLALVAAAYHMRFPPPWKSEWWGKPIYRFGGQTKNELGLS